MRADAIIVGVSLAGLVAACELCDAGKRVIMLEQEGENSLGGLHTDLDSRILEAGGQPIYGFNAAGGAG